MNQRARAQARGCRPSLNRRQTSQALTSARGLSGRPRLIPGIGALPRIWVCKRIGVLTKIRVIPAPKREDSRGTGTQLALLGQTLVDQGSHFRDQAPVQLPLLGKVMNDIAGNGGIQGSFGTEGGQAPGEADEATTDAILVGITSHTVNEDDFPGLDHRLILHGANGKKRHFWDCRPRSRRKPLTKGAGSVVVS